MDRRCLFPLTFWVFLLACIGLANSLKCLSCLDPCDKTESEDCNDGGFCMKKLGAEDKLLSKACVPASIAKAVGLENGKCKDIPGSGKTKKECYCNDKDDCNSSSLAKPTLWTSLLVNGLVCFYISVNG